MPSPLPLIIAGFYCWARLALIASPAMAISPQIVHYLKHGMRAAWAAAPVFTYQK